MIPIGVNRPAFGGTVPHFHQMSRVPRNETDVPRPAKWDRCPAFLENGIIFFFVADYFIFLPCNATKWRSSIKARSILCTPTDAVYISRLAAVINHCCPPAASTLLVTCHRPLSRRLDRCDRMIQNEGNDSRKLFTLKIALCRYRFLKISGGGPPDPPFKAHLASLDGPSFVPRKLLSGLTCMDSTTVYR